MEMTPLQRAALTAIAELRRLPSDDERTTDAILQLQLALGRELRAAELAATENAEGRALKVLRRIQAQLALLRKDEYIAKCGFVEGVVMGEECAGVLDRVLTAKPAGVQ